MPEANIIRLTDTKTKLYITGQERDGNDYTGSTTVTIAATPYTVSKSHKQWVECDYVPAANLTSVTIDSIT